MQNFSSTSQINFLEIEVSEEIDIKNLKKFISTSLSLNNKHLTSKDRIYLNYIKELKQYQKWDRSKRGLECAICMAECEEAKKRIDEVK